MPLRTAATCPTGPACRDLAAFGAVPDKEPLPSNAGLVGFPPISIHNPDIFASLPGPSNSQPAGTFHGMPYGLVSTPAIPPFSYPFTAHQHHFPPMMGMEVPGMSPSVLTADPQQSQTFFNFNHMNT
ncbi:uncharacterized protein EI90DRAFT_3149530 [Cantharellus anzutake]|uniref:uncharacterized protein n=1 Tax=Cantharellus anzutake TaxID=1750568 RepID=UPI001906BED3|nr:uncharacterized protein EI90DRAFT_3149530 [Cantharellus anzutake]KAF8344106.1 hypothetical protein EI90DRAFT_3149530 [Cantharellus anzutake]